MRRRRERGDLRCLAIAAARRFDPTRRHEFSRRLRHISPLPPVVLTADPLHDRYLIFRYRAIEMPKIARYNCSEYLHPHLRFTIHK